MLHSVANACVHVTPNPEFFLYSGLRDGWRVYRLRFVDSLPYASQLEWSAKVSQVAQFYLGQAYNFGFFDP
jgi:hypothetical protein